MAPAFSKEAILTGAVDYLCLVCEQYIKNERDVANHVNQQSHRENLKNVTSIEKYRGDRVKQIKRWYFCELCNVLLSAEKKIDLHIEESKHVENKSSQSLERVGDLVIVPDSVKIHENTWHGLIDRTCILCDVDFDDKEAHKRDTNHVIKLIQSKTININNNIYRLTVDSTFHCLICNKLEASITAHFDNAQHKELLQKCREVKKSEDDLNSCETMLKSNKQKNEVLNDTENIANDNDLDRTNIVNNIVHFQMNGMNINFESLTAVCKKCSINLEFKCRVIENHIQEHKNELNTKKLPTSGTSKEYKRPDTNDDKSLVTTPESPKQRENKNNEILAKKSTKSAQKIKSDYNTEKKKDAQQVDEKQKMSKDSDESEMIPHMDNYSKIHENTNNNVKVKSRNTKDNEIIKEPNAKRCKLQKVCTRVFITKITGVLDESIPQTFPYIIINDKYYIHTFSFMLLNLIGKKQWRCLLCEANLYFSDLNSHSNEKEHVRMLMDLAVVTHSSEFIREIRSGVFHCGFCNTVETSWPQMEDHLKSTAHKESKTSAGWRLVEFAPELEKNIKECRNKNDLFQHIRLNY